MPGNDGACRRRPLGAFRQCGFCQTNAGELFGLPGSNPAQRRSLYLVEPAGCCAGGYFENGEVHKGAQVGIPLKMMNRHGLIAGATGSGKTKTLQILAEQLSQQGVPVLMMDVKGDLSGIAAVGVMNDKNAQAVTFFVQSTGDNSGKLILSQDNNVVIDTIIDNYKISSASLTQSENSEHRLLFVTPILL